MQKRPGLRKVQSSSRSAEARNVNITSAIGIEETAGSIRARRHSLFTQTVIWVTGLICTAFLLGTLAQAWSNSQLMQKVQDAQAKLQQAQVHNGQLAQQAQYYQNPSVIENEARQQLGYVKPGEHAVVIISSTDQSQPQTPTKKHTQGTQNFWQAWWNSLFGM